MRKNRIRLNEGQLRNIIKESVKRILQESDIPAGYDDYEYFEDDGTGGRTAIADPYMSDMSDSDYEDANRQREIDSDWGDIEAADDDFNNYHANIGMRNFEDYSNENVYPDSKFGELGMRAQDPSEKGNFARKVSIFNYGNNGLNFVGGDHNFKKHNIKDKFWNKP